MSVDGVLPLRIYEQSSEGLRSVNSGNNNADQTLNLNTVTTLHNNTVKPLDTVTTLHNNIVKPLDTVTTLHNNIVKPLHLNDLDAQETPKLRPKRSVPVPSFYFEDDPDKDEKPGGSRKAKKEAVGQTPAAPGTSRRNDYDLPPPNENTSKLSNDMKDCCKTMCKICNKPYGLTQMRGHTLSKHKLQITKYKEIYGPFVIIDVVYHKCQLCGKLILLDGDFLGAHIKHAHKMKERDYSDQYIIKMVKFKDTKSEKISKGSAKKLKSTKPKKKLKKKSKVNKMLNFEFDFNTLEYDCNLKDCEMCGRTVAVDLNQSKVIIDEEVTKYLDKVFVDEEVTKYLDMDETKDSREEFNTAEDGNGPSEDGTDQAKDGIEGTNLNKNVSSLSEMQVDDIGVDVSHFSNEEMEVDEDFDTSMEDFSNSDSNEASGDNEDSFSEDEHKEFGPSPDNEIIIKSDNDKNNDLEAIDNVNKNENSTEEEITLDSDDFNLSSASDSETIAREFKMTQKETGSLKFTITNITNVNR